MEESNRKQVYFRVAVEMRTCVDIYVPADITKTHDEVEDMAKEAFRSSYSFDSDEGADLYIKDVELLP